MSSVATLISNHDADIHDLLHSIIDVNRKAMTKALEQTNALFKFSSMHQELNANALIISDLQKQVSAKLIELRPLTFEAQFLKDHLNATIKVEETVSPFKLEEMDAYVNGFISSVKPMSFADQDLDHLPDFGSDHELQLAKIANKYKNDTGPLKVELYTNVYNSELQRLEILCHRVAKIDNEIVLCQRQLEESERIKTIYSAWLMELIQKIQNLTNGILELRNLRKSLKRDSQIWNKDIKTEDDDEDDDGYYTPAEDLEG